MYLSDFWWLYPLVIVWVIGFFLAIRSWQRHPQVSAAVLVSIGCMLLSYVGQQVVYSLLFPAVQSNVADVAFYLQISTLTASLLRAAGWVAILVAIFGWRDVAPGTGNRPLQFSTKGLLIATFVVAVLCGLMQGLAALLGEAAAIVLTLLQDIPAVLCWIAGCWLAVARRHQHPAVSRNLLVAIALLCTSLAVSIAVMALLITGTYAPGFPLISSLVWLVTSPVSWALLLAAAFGWRTIYAEAPASPFREKLT